MTIKIWNCGLNNNNNNNLSCLELIQSWRSVPPINLEFISTLKAYSLSIMLGAIGINPDLNFLRLRILVLFVPFELVASSLVADPISILYVSLIP